MVILSKVMTQHTLSESYALYVVAATEIDADVQSLLLSRSNCDIHPLGFIRQTAQQMNRCSDVKPCQLLRNPAYKAT